MLGTRRILVVSNDHQLWGFEMTPERQASLKIAIDSFQDPFAALDRLSREPGYDLGLVDIKMPSMNGLQFAKAARRAGSRAKIALVTAHAMEKSEIDALIPALKVDAFSEAHHSRSVFGIAGPCGCMAGREKGPLIDAPA